jgi:predicted small integral membrane protein
LARLFLALLGSAWLRLVLLGFAEKKKKKNLKKKILKEKNLKKK